MTDAPPLLPTLSPDALEVLRWLDATERGTACWDAGAGRWRVLGDIGIGACDARELLDPGLAILHPGGPGGGRMLKITAAGRAHVARAAALQGDVA